MTKTSPLIDESQRLVEEAERYERLRSSADSVERLDLAVQALEEPASRIERRSNLELALKSRVEGLFTDDLKRTRQDLIGRVTAFSKALEEDHDVLQGPERKELPGALMAFAEAYIEALDDAVEKYVGTLIPEVSEPLIDALEEVPSFRQAAESIRENWTAVEAARQTITEEADLEQLEKRASALRDSLDSLHEEDETSASALAFLHDAVKGTGASMGALSPEVLGWFKKKGLDDGFTVRPRAR